MGGNKSASERTPGKGGAKIENVSRTGVIATPKTGTTSPKSQSAIKRNSSEHREALKRLVDR